MLQKVERTLLFLTLLLLPTQFGKHFWFDFSYVYSLPIDYLSPAIYFWDILVICLLITFFLKRPQINYWALNLFLLFLLTQLISVTNGAGLFRLEQYLISGLFAVYLASQSFPELSQRAFIPLTLSLIIQSVIGISQVVLGRTIGLWILGERSFSLSTPGIAKFDLYGQQWLRPYATFSHPNTLAAYLSLIPVLLLIFDKSKTWFGVSTILSAITLFLTVSRTAIFTGVGSILFLISKKWRPYLLVTLIILLPVLYARYAALINFDSLSLLRREQLNSIAFSVFLEAPFFGVGLNNFIPYSADQLLVGPSRFLQPVHNIYLLTLAETGVIGFLGLMTWLFYPIWKLKSSKYFLVIFLSILFLGLFDHYFLTQPQGYRLLFLIWGFAFSYIWSKLET